MSWRHGRWSVEHPLPVGAATIVEEGVVVSSGDTLASGSPVTSVHLVDGARRVGVAAHDLDRVLRVRPVADVRRGSVLARTGRRFARSATSPVDGRLVHITSDGDFCIAEVVAEWRVRSAIDGIVAASGPHAVTVEGDCWALQGCAAYGPDAFGEISLAVDGPGDALAPTRVDVRSRDRILVGGSRVAAEAITRAHACGIAGIVAGAAPAAGLRVVYGDDTDAHGRTTFLDAATVLCLIGFGSAPLPAEIFDPLVRFGGQRASIHTASARLFVMAALEDAGATREVPLLALADDHSAVTPVSGLVERIGRHAFASGYEVEAVSTPSGPLPASNVIPFDAER